MQIVINRRYKTPLLLQISNMVRVITVLLIKSIVLLKVQCLETHCGSSYIVDQAQYRGTEWLFDSTEEVLHKGTVVAEPPKAIVELRGMLR